MSDDDLAPLLSGEPARTDPGFRQRVLERSEARLASRHRRRVALRIATLAASVALGATLTRLAPGQTQAVRIETVRLVRVPAETVPKPRPPTPPLTGYELVLAAEQADAADAARLYRAAGDRYLHQERNFQAAIECYRLFLELTPEPDWEDPDREESWLLVSLIRDRRSEVVHAKPPT